MRARSLLLAALCISHCAHAGSTDDLFTAIKSGDLAAAKAAIAAGGDVNAFDANGNTPLATAAWYPDIVRELIAAKADVNKFSSNGITNPLISAASWGVSETVTLLTASGADVNAKDINGNPPLFYAAFMGASAPVMQWLIDKGADARSMNKFNQNALMFLAANGRSAEKRVEQLKGIVPYLEKAGVKLPAAYANPNVTSFSSLEERIDVLLKAGLNIDDESALTVPPTAPNASKINATAQKLGLKQWPLYCALGNLWDRAAMVKALLAKGANAKKEFGSSNFNWTLLHAMSMQPSMNNAAMVEEAADALIKAGADMNQKDLQGYTPLIKAAKEGNVGLASALVKDGANLNIVEKETTGETHYEGFELVQGFVKTWRTARDWAAETKHDDIYRLIADAGGKGASEVMH